MRYLRGNLLAQIGRWRRFPSLAGAVTAASVAGAAAFVSAADSPNIVLGCPLDSSLPAQSQPQVVDPPRGRPIERNAACLQTPPDAKARYLRGSVTLVDVRQASDFDRYRIPNSLNIPLHLVKTKAFLKFHSVVLLNEGRSTAALEQACGELRKAGFRQVTILQGGLNGWLAAGGEIAGDATARDSLDRMTAEEMFVERNYANWLVLDFSNGARKEIYSWLPANVERVRAAPANKHAEGIRAVVDRRRQRTPGMRIVVVAETDADYEPIERTVNKAGITGVFYLAGGLRGYADSLDKQIAMWRQQDRPPRFPSCRG